MSSSGDKRQAVLVVDDSDEMRELLAYQLSLHGYDVIEARDGREAVAMAQERRPALILMDIEMPVMDGLATTRSIRQIEGLHDTPVIAFSAYGGDHLWQALEAGCNEYVNKAAGTHLLVAVVRRYLPPD